MLQCDLLISDINIASMNGNSSYGIIEKGAIAVTDSTIVWIGKGDLVPELNAKKTLSLQEGMTVGPSVYLCIKLKK